MKMLVACEFSGIVREAFAKKGWDAWSCDLLPTELPGQHIQDDVLNHLNEDWDLMIAHPPCTYIANSGARWLFEKEGRWQRLSEATTFFKALLNAPIERIAIENPLPHKWGAEQIGIKYAQKVQPYQFGTPQKKGICLWLKNLPLLQLTNILVPPKNKEELKKWEKVWREPPGKDQWKNRSRTFPNIAEVMAEQWTLAAKKEAGK
jgi:hypothetical protein